MTAFIGAWIAGLASALSWPVCGLLVLGALMGAAVGILPGLSGATLLAMVLPFVVGLSPTGAFALMVGVATVASTTGDMTSILLGVPGEPGSAATIADGHPMTRRGEASRALGASLAASLAGSLFGAVALTAAIPVASSMIRWVASPELFMFAMLGVCLVAPLSRSSLLRGLTAGGIGLLLATVGLDPQTATPRFTFGQLSLWDGVGAIPLALGLFAIPEIVAMAATGRDGAHAVPTGSGGLWSGVREVGRRWRLVLRSSAIGTVVGFLPGVGSTVSQWVAYADAAGHASSDRAFGEGAIEGVIAPSAANNATLGGSLAPTLAFGIPGSLLSAMLLSALIVKGLVPGPRLLMPESQGGQATLVFSLAWFMVIGNLLAVALSGIAAKHLMRIARISASRLVPFLILLTFIGAYAERQSMFDVVLTGIFGVLGLVLVRYQWPRAPVLMGVVLGPLAENRLFLSMDAFGFSWLVRPGVVVLAAVLVAQLVLFRRLGPTRQPGSDKVAKRMVAIAPEPGELVFAGILFCLFTAALLAAGTYPGRSGTVPRLVAAVSMTLLAAAFAPLAGNARQDQTFGETVSTRVSWTGPAARWIPIFMVGLWSFGFSVGAPLVILAYLLLEIRDRPGRSVVLAVSTYLVLNVALQRMLGMYLWQGAIQAWLS